MSIADTLPDFDENKDSEIVPCETTVVIVDVLNISNSRQSQLTALDRESHPLAKTTINELSDDDEASNEVTVRASKSATIKYVVKDAKGKLAYMLFRDLNQPQFNVKSHISIAQGTAVWRSVLVPRSVQVKLLRAGINMSADQQMARLKIPH